MAKIKALLAFEPSFTFHSGWYSVEHGLGG